MHKTIFTILFIFTGLIYLKAQYPDHQWVNEVSLENHSGVLHKTFFSGIHQTEIGYSIVLPTDYSDIKNVNRRYPVVYCLTEGSPGNENRTWYFLAIEQTHEIDLHTPMIYVWNNGGKGKSHYDFPQFNSYAESSFIKELIPLIDSKYRTIPDRMARGIQGYGVGGQATARYIFKYPELFSVAVSMSGGQQWEKENSDNNGNNGEYKPGDNSWDLAKAYAENPGAPVNLYIFVGTDDVNYESNINWSSHLNDLDIHHSITAIQGANHDDAIDIIRQIGRKTLHHLFYQKFLNAIDNYNNK